MKEIDKASKNYFIIFEIKFYSQLTTIHSRYRHNDVIVDEINRYLKRKMVYRNSFYEYFTNNYYFNVEALKK